MPFHKNAVAYAATSFASSMMNSIFFFYYVKLFLDRYHVSEPWFQFAQVVYMLWNAINDPLFGYFQDQSTWDFCSNRQKSILYGAPLWALCFLLPWFPWGNYEEGNWLAGVHLMVTLCAYDALLTFVLLSQCAIFAEISVQHEDRLRLVKYSQIASAMGNTGVFFSGIVSDNMNNMFNLQIYCVLIALIAWASMRYCALNTRTMYDNKGKEPSKTPLIEQKQKREEEKLSFKGACVITWQILKNRNFIAFVIMNFFQVLHVTFGANFLLIFANHLIPQDVLPSVARSAVYGASFVLPQLMILLGGGIIAKFGSYKVILISFMVQIFLGITLYFVGREHYYFLALFFILDMSIPHAAFSLFNIPLSDIIDEDMNVNKARYPRSSMVFGTNALITKPANSFAPMLVVAILNKYGYEALKEYGVPGAVVPSGVTPPDQSEIAELHNVMFKIMCTFPIVLSIIQLLAWSTYKLKSTHVTEAKYMDT
uniref:transmembrane protein 180-like n=1 Tax=Styela clava TaxID=7725 RepID=UPI0019395C8C|nr:transmembrane protein 180-like [Styela clava]